MHQLESEFSPNAFSSFIILQSIKPNAFQFILEIGRSVQSIRVGYNDELHASFVRSCLPIGFGTIFKTKFQNVFFRTDFFHFSKSNILIFPS